MQALLEQSYESLLEEMGETQLLSYARYSVQLELRSDPAAGLAALDKLSPLLGPAPSTDEDSRARLWELQLRLIAGYISERESKSLHRPAAGLPKRLTRRHVEAGNRLERAFESIPEDREAEGLRELDKAMELLPALGKRFADPADHFRALLLVNAGSLAFNSGDIWQATNYYTQALPILLRLHCTKQLMDLLDPRLKDIIEFQDVATTEMTLSALGALSNAVESTLGAKGTTKLQAMYTELMSRWSLTGRMAQELENGSLFRLLRVAKGRRFASTLVGAPDYDWRQDPEVLTRLKNIEATRSRALQNEGDPEFTRDLADLDMRLMGPINAGEIHAGRTNRERFENLRHTFDAYLTRRFLGSTLKEIPRERSPAEIAIDPAALHLATLDVQARLDEETVLLDFLVTDYGPTQQTVFVLALTRDEAHYNVSLLTKPGPSTQGETDKDFRSALSQHVSKLRSEIRKDPGRDEEVTARAHELRQPRILLGSIVDFLEHQHAVKGRRHLCIVPHRALHYLPFHLLGDNGETLADRWVVTYLPNLHLLFANRPKVGRKTARSMAAIGLGFSNGNPWRLSPIETARASATGVAELFDEEPLLDGDATEKNVAAALQDTRYAYFCTHGLQCVYAPAFHRIFCAPDGAEDGAVSAYEIQGLDLSRIEVLGTAVCETALGRFDPADNLTGLPASFFQAGVQSMVGTLWEVPADTADLFFLTLFLELLNGSSRREAVAEAQRATRHEYPHYRDWGAFYFMGAWT